MERLRRELSCGRFSVQELVFDQDRVTGIRGHQKNGATVTETARIVVGADGMFSTVAKAVKAEEYNSKPPLEGSWYSYWSASKCKDGICGCGLIKSSLRSTPMTTSR